ncbi:MAG: ThiF family adenylyltransferase [Chitinispirillaceae bacterium]|jgi:predicted ThiF/HesA family dinucleotide-utilizing enzyme
MSRQLFSRNTDLTRLLNEGFDVAIKHDHLFVKQVPYLNSKKEIKYGTLISNLCLNNDSTQKPDPHTVFFDGETPYKADGAPLNTFAVSNESLQLGGIIVANMRFSAKPPNGYIDYYHKMTTYVAMLSGQVQLIDPNVTAKTFPVIEDSEEDSVFKYIDSASTRAGIYDITKKLELGKIAIVGLGGTGSYVLDLVAKTPVREIHLFDEDKFLQHNAFRSPGAPSGAELSERLSKVHYFERIYSKMRRGIICHPEYIDINNADLLKEMNFIFLCIDKGSVKRLVLDKLLESNIPFIDVGMGVKISGNSLFGILRVTTGTSAQNNHINQKIIFSDNDANNEYDNNIQIADLNALNAALAVIKWKKIFGFYNDLENEHFCAYTIDGNHLLNEDISCAG